MNADRSPLAKGHAPAHNSHSASVNLPVCAAQDRLNTPNHLDVASEAKRITGARAGIRTSELADTDIII